MAEYMFRIVKKETGKIVYFESLCGCNKAKIVERAKRWCENHNFKGGDEAAKKYQVEFSSFKWDYVWNPRRNIGCSDYGRGWNCTTVCNLYQKDGSLYIGSLVAGRALDPDTAKKAKGGAWGEMMIDGLGC